MVAAPAMQLRGFEKNSAIGRGQRQALPHDLLRGVQFVQQLQGRNQLRAQVRIRRRQGQGLPEVLHGQAHVLGFAQQAAHMTQAPRLRGVCGDGPFESRLGLFEFAQDVVADAEIEQAFGVRWIEAEQGAQGADGRRVVALSHLQQGQVQQGRLVMGFDGQCFPVGRFRRFEVAARAQHVAEVVPGLAVAGGDRHRALECVSGLAGGAGVEQRASQVVEREGVVRLQGERLACDGHGAAGIAGQLRQRGLIDQVVDAAGFRQRLHQAYRFGVQPFADQVFTQPVAEMAVAAARLRAGQGRGAVVIARRQHGAGRFQNRIVSHHRLPSRRPF